MCIENEDHWSISLYLIHNANKRKKNKKMFENYMFYRNEIFVQGPNYFKKGSIIIVMNYIISADIECRDQCGDFCITNTVPTKRAQRITFYSLAVYFTLTGNNKRNSIYFLFC